MSGVLMLFCVLLQDDSSAEHDDEEASKRVSEFATLRTLCFLHWLDFLVSFKLNFISELDFACHV